MILIVEDEKTLQETLRYTLSKQGYEVLSAWDGKSAINIAKEKNPDLIVLDIMLPVLDGFEVCRILRQDMNTPILMLTARDDEIDRVIGLEIGADDYLTKPFSMRELLARIKALLRRIRMIHEELEKQVENDSEIISFGDLTINTARREALLRSQELSLKPKEFELLLFFAHHRGQVLTRELLLQRVWGWDFTGGSRTVDVHVRWLREKIEPDQTNPVRIKTIRGAGYLFEG
jgi:DNA-binding response OmpR family regulator